MIVEFAYSNSRAPTSVEDMNYCTVKVVSRIRTPSLVLYDVESSLGRLVSRLLR
jgi:hypothetical protein